MKNSHILIAIFVVCIACGFLSCGIMDLSQQTEKSVVETKAAPRRIRLEDLTEGTKEPEDTEESAAEASSEEIETEDPAEESGDSFLWEGGYAYAYQTLSEAEQIWYEDIAKALGTMTDGVKLSGEGLVRGLDESNVDRIFQYVLNDHPELFYVEGYSYTKYTRGEKTVAIEFTGTYSMDWDTARRRWDEIAHNVENILAIAPDFRDDYEKVKYGYEILILNTDYDQKAPDNQNIYSVFAGHASVCQGYAKAFQYLMNRLDVDCALVQGEVLETGEGHAWNLVRADGAFYYVDATWGDVSYRSVERNEEDDADRESAAEESPIQISYDYLCITTDQLLRTHRPDDTVHLPDCTADADNYYVREDALFTEYDRDQMKRLVERKIFAEAADTSKNMGDMGKTVRSGEVSISLRCADETCYDAVRTALLDEREFFDYLEGTGIDSFVYSGNDKQYTLTFFMMTSTK